MRFNIRTFMDSLSLPSSINPQLNARNALALTARSDRIPPGGLFPDDSKHKDPKPPKSKETIAVPDLKPAPKSTTPPPAPATVTVTSTSTSTKLVTTTFTQTWNVTYHDLATELLTLTSHVPTTLHTTVTANQTLITTATATSTQVAPTHTISAVPVPEKKVSTAGILATVSGVMNLALLVLMFFLVRRFYRMYRAERVLRKQTQTEGIELRVGKGMGNGSGGEEEKREEWEK